MWFSSGSIEVITFYVTRSQCKLPCIFSLSIGVLIICQCVVATTLLNCCSTTNGRCFFICRIINVSSICLNHYMMIICVRKRFRDNKISYLGRVSKAILRNLNSLCDWLIISLSYINTRCTSKWPKTAVTERGLRNLICIQTSK